MYFQAAYVMGYSTEEEASLESSQREHNSTKDDELRIQLGFPWQADWQIPRTLYESLP